MAAFTCATICLAGCAVSDTAAEQRIERERTQAAEAARQAEQIKQLQQQVDAANGAEGGQQPAPAPAPPAVNAPAAQPPVTGRVPSSGTYTGYGNQRGLTGSGADKSYSVEMVFSSGGSSIRYPSLSCAGRLQPVGFDQGRRVYRENMTTGHCDNNGHLAHHGRQRHQAVGHLSATVRPLRRGRRPHTLTAANGEPRWTLIVRR